MSNIFIWVSEFHQIIFLHLLWWLNILPLILLVYLLKLVDFSKEKTILNTQSNYLLDDVAVQFAID